MPGDLAASRFRMAYGWTARNDVRPWDEAGVSAFAVAIDKLSPALTGLRLRQFVGVRRGIGVVGNTLERGWGDPHFFRPAVEKGSHNPSILGNEVAEVHYFVQPNVHEGEEPAFFAMLCWTTRQEVLGGSPYRPPQNAQALRFVAFAIDTQRLDAAGGPKIFDDAVSGLLATLGPGYGGVLLDRPWRFDTPFGDTYGRGPQETYDNLWRVAPRRDGYIDLDSWRPTFDIQFADHKLKSTDGAARRRSFPGLGRLLHRSPDASNIPESAGKTERQPATSTDRSDPIAERGALMRDLTRRRFRMAFGWTGRNDVAPWDATAVAAFQATVDRLGPALGSLELSQSGFAFGPVPRIDRLRKRKWKEPFFGVYRPQIPEDLWYAELFLESETVEHGFSEFFASLFWSTTWETHGGHRVRPPGCAPGLLYFCLVIDTSRLASTIGPEAFDRHAAELLASLGTDNRGGIMVDIPWHADGPFSESFVQGGPTVARMNLLVKAPRLDGAVDLDVWSPEFDIPF